MSKKSFILMRDLLSSIDLMTDEEAGKMFKAVIGHVDGNKNNLPRELQFAFIPIQNQLNRDMEKYNAFVEKQRLNGKKGGRPQSDTLISESQKIVPTDTDGLHFIYLIRDVSSGEYKIGETKNLKQRRYDIKKPTNDLVICDFALMGAYEAQQLEKEIIKRYIDVRISGDWFNFTDDHKNQILGIFANKGLGLQERVAKPNNLGTVNETATATDNGTGTKTEKPKKKRASPSLAKKPDDVDQEIWDDWQHLRKVKKAPVTNTVIKGAIEQAKIAGVPLNEFLQIWCRRGSQGLEASWIKPDDRQVKKDNHNGFAEKDYQSGAVTPEWAK